MNGQRVSISSDYQGSGSYGFSVDLGAYAIQPGQRGRCMCTWGESKTCFTPTMRMKRMPVPSSYQHILVRNMWQARPTSWSPTTCRPESGPRSRAGTARPPGSLPNHRVELTSMVASLTHGTLRTRTCTASTNLGHPSHARMSPPRPFTRLLPNR